VNPPEVIGPLEFDEGSMASTPMVTFTRWFAQAQASGEAEAEVVSLATVGNDGLPAVRFVLLKAADARGFVVYSNYRSKKGADIDAHPVAALAFRWALLNRQVRATGRVKPLAPEESDAYFASRPRLSQLGAWASPQSQVIDGRLELQRRLTDAEERFAGHEVPRPPWWGGLRIEPSVVEFWQGRDNRLHDRLRYRRDGEGWLIERLAP
jgi:pyridoxamine 5'-phosphate oxidase